jgi:hypothetical protein
MAVSTSRAHISFACLAIGASIGWLTGLAVSPVLQTILGAVIATVATLMAAASGLEREGQTRIPNVNPWPMMFMVLGLAVAATFGLSYRIGLIDRPAAAAQAAASTVAASQTKPEVPQASAAVAAQSALPRVATVDPGLLGLRSGVRVTAEDCERFRDASDVALSGEFAISTEKKFRDLANEKPSAAVLRRVTALLCP